ncbi:type III pantothenate kinase [Halosquirtibacter xylanolyticus]|uniref:type III pantothenate kinase n=1 Tax=Halosquirtibacter xylanolyticus TaxID=3374599 RepID=UPI0037483490|nr:type III pantothenate kinase [Prolixibacteraceae bacterium]
MNLIIDIGNTRIKYALFESQKLIHLESTSDFDLPLITKWVEDYPIKSAIVSDVRDVRHQIEADLMKLLSKVLFLDEKTTLPINNSYRTPETLGKDRIAAVVGAWSRFPNRNSLVIDAGTAITYDFIDQTGTYLGGNISPGLQTRFRALHDYTGKLPLLEVKAVEEEIGKDTTNAIQSGVGLGLTFEVEKYISHFSEKYHDLHVIITGGDAVFFETILKNSIFVDLNVTLIGLNRILIDNDK